MSEYLNYSRSVAEAPISSDAVPDYLFTSDLMRSHAREVAEDVGGMPLLGSAYIETRADPRLGGRQFFVGPPGSGAPMHFHTKAINVLAFGRKRWFLLPPDKAIYSSRPVSEWIAEGGPERLGASECVQEAGDILYVPGELSRASRTRCPPLPFLICALCVGSRRARTDGWSHATLNVEESIGMAFEFDMPDSEATWTDVVSPFLSRQAGG